MSELAPVWAGGDPRGTFVVLRGTASGDSDLLGMDHPSLQRARSLKSLRFTGIAQFVKSRCSARAVGGGFGPLGVECQRRGTSGPDFRRKAPAARLLATVAWFMGNT